MTPASIDDFLRESRARVGALDAEVLLAHVLGKSRGWLFAHGDDALDPALAARAGELVARRAAGEPAAYLLGHRGFWRFDVRVSPATLIPRPETELLVELALERLAHDHPVAAADLGTGSGAVALALAFERPRAQIVATDASHAALEVAHANARTLQLGNIEFLAGDWFAPLAGRRFDVVASNPPYIAEGDPHLPGLRFEPRAALVSGQDGLDAIRAIVAGAPAHLVPGGWLLLEHGAEQGAAVRALLDAAGFIDVQTAPDLEHRDRVSLGRMPD